MMTPGEQLVRAVMVYAAEADGAGYWLHVHLQDGKMVQGSCYEPENGIMRMDVYTDDKGVNYSEPVWVNLACVTHVQIKW